jgi:hypothetical protein
MRLRSHRTHGRLLSRPRTTEVVRRPRTTSRDGPKPNSRHRASRQAGHRGSTLDNPGLWSAAETDFHRPDTPRPALSRFRADIVHAPEGTLSSSSLEPVPADPFEPVHDSARLTEVWPTVSPHGGVLPSRTFRLGTASPRRDGVGQVRRAFGMPPEGCSPSTRTASRLWSHACRNRHATTLGHHSARTRRHGPRVLPESRPRERRSSHEHASIAPEAPRLPPNAMGAVEVTHRPVRALDFRKTASNAHPTNNLPRSPPEEGHHHSKPDSPKAATRPSSRNRAAAPPAPKSQWEVRGPKRAAAVAWRVEARRTVQAQPDRLHDCEQPRGKSATPTEVGAKPAESQPASHVPEGP